MDRTEFERLRDLPGKFIAGDIVLERGKETSPLLSAIVAIENSAGVEAKLKVELNEETDAKTLNVWIPGIGPICRLDVDTRPHKPCGRSHKHSLQQPDCPHPSINLSRNVTDRAEMQGKTIHEVFTNFCVESMIEHRGVLIVPTA
jgi:hypothetical protein